MYMTKTQQKQWREKMADLAALEKAAKDASAKETAAKRTYENMKRLKEQADIKLAAKKSISEKTLALSKDFAKNKEEYFKAMQDAEAAKKRVVEAGMEMAKASKAAQDAATKLAAEKAKQKK
jgi:hypothetical protein